MDNFKTFTKAFSDFILSASGFRKVFAKDGNEESSSIEISMEDSIASAIIADIFSKIISRRGGKTIALGMDARPTGLAISRVLNSVFIKNNFGVEFTGITAAPEFMAWVKTNSRIDGFAYISASHNPIGHNGFKFGFSDGAVMGGQDSKDFIYEITKAASDIKVFSGYERLVSKLTTTLPDSSKNKKQAEDAYCNFSNFVITGTEEKCSQTEILKKIKQTAKNIGIIGELNGSARGLSIDKNFFESFGLKTIMINNKPGQIVHGIVPEGSSLDLCRDELEKAHSVDSSFVLGYVPDNDGDRGNVVYYNEKTKTSEILQAQEVFALCVKSELEFLRQINPDSRVAVVVNGPTSMRIESIAALYNAKVFRAEVGEANVVNLAEAKRAEGYNIRILGEGSNGGNITYPATVRDPLNYNFCINKTYELL